MTEADDIATLIQACNSSQIEELLKSKDTDPYDHRAELESRIGSPPPPFIDVLNRLSAPDMMESEAGGLNQAIVTILALGGHRTVPIDQQGSRDYATVKKLLNYWIGKYRPDIVNQYLAAEGEDQVDSNIDLTPYIETTGSNAVRLVPLVENLLKTVYPKPAETPPDVDIELQIQRWSSQLSVSAMSKLMPLRGQTWEKERKVLIESHPFPFIDVLERLTDDQFTKSDEGGLGPVPLAIMALGGREFTPIDALGTQNYQLCKQVVNSLIAEHCSDVVALTIQQELDPDATLSAIEANRLAGKYSTSDLSKLDFTLYLTDTDSLYGKHEVLPIVQLVVEKMKLTKIPLLLKDSSASHRPSESSETSLKGPDAFFASYLPEGTKLAEHQKQEIIYKLTHLGFVIDDHGKVTSPELNNEKIREVSTTNFIGVPPEAWPFNFTPANTAGETRYLRFRFPIDTITSQFQAIQAHAYDFPDPNDLMKSVHMPWHIIFEKQVSRVQRRIEAKSGNIFEFAVLGSPEAQFQDTISCDSRSKVIIHDYQGHTLPRLEIGGILQIGKPDVDSLVHMIPKHSYITSDGILEMRRAGSIVRLTRNDIWGTDIELMYNAKATELTRDSILSGMDLMDHTIQPPEDYAAVITELTKHIPVGSNRIFRRAMRTVSYPDQAPRILVPESLDVQEGKNVHLDKPITLRGETLVRKNANLIIDNVHTNDSLRVIAGGNLRVTSGTLELAQDYRRALEISGKDVLDAILPTRVELSNVIIRGPVRITDATLVIHERMLQDHLFNTITFENATLIVVNDAHQEIITRHFSRQEINGDDLKRNMKRWKGEADSELEMPTTFDNPREKYIWMLFHAEHVPFPTPTLQETNNAIETLKHIDELYPGILSQLQVQMFRENTYAACSIYMQSDTPLFMDIHEIPAHIRIGGKLQIRTSIKMGAATQDNASWGIYDRLNTYKKSLALYLNDSSSAHVIEIGDGHIDGGYNEPVSLFVEEVKEQQGISNRSALIVVARPEDAEKMLSASLYQGNIVYTMPEEASYTSLSELHNVPYTPVEGDTLPQLAPEQTYALFTHLNTRYALVRVDSKDNKSMHAYALFQWVGEGTDRQKLGCRVIFKDEADFKKRFPDWNLPAQSYPSVPPESSRPSIMPEAPTEAPAVIMPITPAPESIPDWLQAQPPAIADLIKNNETLDQVETLLQQQITDYIKGNGDIEALTSDLAGLFNTELQDEQLNRKSSMNILWFQGIFLDRISGIVMGRESIAPDQESRILALLESSDDLRRGMVHIMERNITIGPHTGSERAQLLIERTRARATGIYTALISHQNHALSQFFISEEGRPVISAATHLLRNARMALMNGHIVDETLAVDTKVFDSVPPLTESITRSISNSITIIQRLAQTEPEQFIKRILTNDMATGMKEVMAVNTVSVSVPGIYNIPPEAHPQMIIERSKMALIDMIIDLTTQQKEVMTHLLNQPGNTLRTSLESYRYGFMANLTHEQQQMRQEGLDKIARLYADVGLELPSIETTQAVEPSKPSEKRSIFGGGLFGRDKTKN